MSPFFEFVARLSRDCHIRSNLDRLGWLSGRAATTLRSIETQPFDAEAGRPTGGLSDSDVQIDRRSWFLQLKSS